MKYVLLCPSFYEMIADGELFVFLLGFSIFTEQNTKLTALLSLPNMLFCGGRGKFQVHRIPVCVLWGGNETTIPFSLLAGKWSFDSFNSWVCFLPWAH